jgi:hypothetical protein
MLPKPLVLMGLDAPVPAGSYEVTIVEEPLGDLMHPAYRRVSTTIYLPRLPGRIGIGQAIEVTSSEFDTLLGNILPVPK